jgi:hypothetical protein
MAGFQHCKFCQGTGCWGCNGERRKYEKRQTERIKNWSPPSEKEIDLAKSILSQINPDMSPEEKREKLDALIDKRHKIILQQLEKVKEKRNRANEPE